LALLTYLQTLILLLNVAEVYNLIPVFIAFVYASRYFSGQHLTLHNFRQSSLEQKLSNIWLVAWTFV